MREYIKETIKYFYNISIHIRILIQIICWKFHVFKYVVSFKWCLDYKIIRNTGILDMREQDLRPEYESAWAIALSS